ncbi:phosphocholine-specific phospholipase C [Streptomyces odontomachi]|uniref:phosphocholine-specific phospholipase C n=1 Tax=Streptomyces odontomachi TaxID=2944940 RepID=UPI002109F4DC|nr:phospholipase C, phosphocholine-specific [Streptomyces sp. ODS25]
MTPLNRRRFLQLAGATTSASALTTSIARAAGIPAHRRAGSLQDVEHIVVLTQENRSFDHYFGTLRGVRGFGDPHPVTLPGGKPVWYQPDGAKDVLPFRPAADDLGLKFIQDLAHGWSDTHAAWNQGCYDRWVPAKTATTMAYLTRDDIPFHHALADAFTVCDAYHCSLMGSTDPNRYYLWTGYTGNDGKGGGPVLGNDEAGYSWTTYPERLEQAGVSWKIYQDVGDGLDAAGSWGWIDDAYRGNYGDNSLLYFDQYRTAAPGTPLYDRARTGTDAKNGDGLFDVLKADVQAGRLPQVSWIAAPEAFSEHPNWPANYGAWYIAQVLDALTADPDVWSRTALLITYDENDGFFDHVVPPHPPSSSAQGASGVDVTGELYGTEAPLPYGLGPRVPMLVVSPWSTGGRVCSQVFDHTSVIRFIEQRFGVAEPNISPWRRAVCGDLTSAFDFAGSDTAVPALPDTSGYRPADHDRHDDYVPTPPADPALPRQESGTRPALPLPYDLAADATVSGPGALRVDFASRGAAGAAFHVTSAAEPDAPRTYTVAAGGQLSGTFAADPRDGTYDVSVHGPNGFWRQFTGVATEAGPEVHVRHRAQGTQVELVLTNDAGRAVELTVDQGHGGVRAARLRVAAGRRTVHTVPTTDGWYDLTVTSADGGGFVRRLAGHVETGRISTTDPALGRS